MMEERHRRKGTVYRVRRERDGGLHATFSDRTAAALQDDLWGRWGSRIPVLADQPAKVPQRVRTELLSPRTRDLTDRHLASLFAHHPAASALAEASGDPLVGEYIVEVFYGQWKAGGDSRGTKAPHTAEEMARALNKIVFELKPKLDENGAPVLGSDGKPVLEWGKDAFAWRVLVDVRKRDARELERRVKELRVGTEVWRKVRSFLTQLFEHAAEDETIGIDDDLPNPMSATKAPAQSRPTARKGYLPDVVEKIIADFLYLEALAAAGLHRARGRSLWTPAGVPVPRLPEFAAASADLVAAIAYCSGRPAEVLALSPECLDPERVGHLRIFQRLQNGAVIPGTKSEVYPEKWSLMLGDLGVTIAARAAGRRPDDLLFPYPGTSRPWTPTNYKNWRARFFTPIAKAHGLSGKAADPYALRHVYATMRVAAGHPAQYISASMGTSLLETYSDIRHDLERLGKLGDGYDIAEEIARARRAARATLAERLAGIAGMPDPQPPVRGAAVG